VPDRKKQRAAFSLTGMASGSRLVKAGIWKYQPVAASMPTIIAIKAVALVIFR
jgi:hypothetical protein